jgi:hypothetical protein
MTKKTLMKAMGIVSFLFAAFGGFLKDVAPPPETGAWKWVGLCSFAVLILFLYVSVLSARRSSPKVRRTWLMVSACFFVLAVSFGIVYGLALDRLTFWYPPGNATGRYLAGTVLTPRGQTFHPSPEQYSAVVFEFGLANRDKIWTPESLTHAGHLLCGYYSIFLVSLAACIFCLTEGAMRGMPKA